MAQAFQVAIPAQQVNRNMTTINIYVDAGSTATGMVVGVYLNNNGHPGVLWSTAALTSLKPGAWNTVSVPCASLSGSSYWIAILGTGGTLQLRGQPTGTGLVETSYSSLLNKLPTNWLTGSASISGPVSAYLTGY